MAETTHAAGARASLPKRARAGAAAAAASFDRRLTVSLPRSDAKLSRYSIFVVLYATAFLLEVVELGHHPAFSAAAVCLSALLILNTTRIFSSFS
jgi:hypothetical protein